jgi:hypothetical protein
MGGAVDAENEDWTKQEFATKKVIKDCLRFSGANIQSGL